MTEDCVRMGLRTRDWSPPQQYFCSMKGMNSSMTKDSHRSEPSAFCMYIPDPGGGSFLKLAQTTALGATMSRPVR